jgi:hypothetical protein
MATILKRNINLMLVPKVSKVDLVVGGKLFLREREEEKIKESKH